ncbi:MAG: hypothetical protein ACF8OB_03625 [Phycisphaeraceae bacterium JB051]
MRQMIKNKPDIILKELAAAISVDVVESTIHRALVRMNITLKKVDPAQRTTTHRRDVQTPSLWSCPTFCAGGSLCFSR